MCAQYVSPLPPGRSARHREDTERFIPTQLFYFREQNYETLRASLDEQKKLEKSRSDDTQPLKSIKFLDPYFPNELYDKEFQWVSLAELDPDSVFYSQRKSFSGSARYNLHKLAPGGFGLNWFYVAMGQVCERPVLLDWTMPNAKQQNECDFGIYRFRFWHAGVLREVVVDDLLPFTKAGSPVFVRSAYDPHEFWCALLEKAYAKMHGSYHFLLEGHPEQAFADLTGGFPQAVRLNLATMLSPYILGWELERWLKNGALVTASVKFRDRPGELLDTDLVTGLPYTVLEHKSVRGRPLVKLRSPDSAHTFIHEEAGPALDGCCGCCGGKASEARNAPPNLQHLRVAEFWMRYDEFLQNFHYLISVHLVQQIRASRPIVSRYYTIPEWVPFCGGDRIVESPLLLNHVTGVFVQECNGWSDWERLVGQRQYGVSLCHGENKLLAHLVQESLPLQAPGDLCLLILQAENGRAHRIHDFRTNTNLRPMYDVQISQYGGCFSSMLGRGTYVIIPYCRVDGSHTDLFVPRRFSLRVAVTGERPMRPLTDQVCKPWSTITRLTVSDFTFQIPAKREQLHEVEFLQ